MYLRNGKRPPLPARITERLSEKACLTIVGWVQPTAFSEGLVGCTHPTRSFAASLLEAIRELFPVIHGT